LKKIVRGDAAPAVQEIGSGGFQAAPAAGAAPSLRDTAVPGLNVPVGASPFAPPPLPPGARPIAPRPAAGQPAASPLAAVAQKGVLKGTSFQAYEEAKQILALAEQEAERVRQEAVRLRDEQARLGYEEGYRRGYEEALAGLARLEQETAALFEKIEPQVVALSVKVAEKIIGAELAARPEAIAAVVSQALRTVRHQRDISIRVHPSHVPALEGRKAQLLGVLSRARDLMIRGDESMRPGGCVIETELGTLDADLTTQLEILERALGASR
jgi:type III secretion protein L